jgi:hypothetical protein
LDEPNKTIDYDLKLVAAIVFSDTLSYSGAMKLEKGISLIIEASTLINYSK